MIRKSKTLLLPAVLLILGSSASLAQTSSTAPKQGDMAVSINAGLANSFDDGFEDLEPVLTGTFEYFTTPRLSWRGLLGFTSFEADLPDRPSVDFTFVNANVVYNWEGGRIHPYVTGGIGAYQKDASSGLPPQYEETVLGVNGGGGIDWFLGARWALKFEGAFHGLAGENPDTIFIATGGVMFWF